MKLLVTKEDNIKIPVYVYEVEDQIEATATKTEVPEGITCEQVNFTFRKPNYQDSNTIIRNAQFKMNEGQEPTLDVTVFQEQVLRSLLIDWDLKDEEEKIPLNTASLNKLVPAVARAAVGGILEKIRI